VVKGKTIKEQPIKEPEVLKPKPVIKQDPAKEPL